LKRLPEKHRTVIVLCDLEGATGREVALRLGVPEGTVASRLARGRAILAKRLTRHGLALTGGALALTLSRNAVSAVPPSLVASTMQAAGVFTGGKAVAGLLSANVAALTEGVLKAMLLAKLKTTLAVILVLGAVTLICGVLARGRVNAGGEDGPVRTPDQPAKEAQAHQGKGKQPSTLNDGGKDEGVQPTERATLEGHTNRVDSLAFSGDRKTLASGSADGTIKLWDATTGKETATFKAGTPVGCVAFNRDRKTLASAGQDSTVKLWDVTTGKNTATIQAAVDNVPIIIDCVAFSPDGKTLASGSEQPKIKLWDATTGKETATLEGHTAIVLSVAFSPDSKTLASTSGDGTIKLWDVATGKNSSTLRGHTNTPQISYVYCVAFSPDGKTLASGGQDGTVRLWDVRTGKNTATLKGHFLVLGLAFSPGGKTLASGSDDRTIKLWDVATGENIATLRGHTDAVRSVAFSPGGETLASGSYDKTIKLWRIK
jgi:WD40 repeat protein